MPERILPKPRLLSTWSSALLQRSWGPLLLLVAVILANFNVVFLGQSLVSTANSDPVDYRSAALRNGNFRGESTILNWHDQGTSWWQWEPAGKLWSRLFRRGRIPFWDPEVGGGVDAHVNVTGTQYYPPYVALLIAGDTPLLRDVYYLSEMFAAGLFSYWFLRRNQMRRAAALVMGVSYMLSGPLVQNINTSLGQSFAILPMMVFAMDLAVSANSWRRVGWSSLLLGAAALSSFLPAVISGYLLVSIYFATDSLWFWMKGQRALSWSRFGKGATATLLSIFLLGFLLIPVKLASKADKIFASWYSGIGLQRDAPDQMLSLISPSIGFNVDQIPNPALALFSSPGMQSQAYLGLIPILIAVFGISGLWKRQSRLLFFFTLATAVVFLKLIGAYPLQLLGTLPLFQALHFVPYFWGALAFGVAGLAGIGIESLTAAKGRKVIAIALVSLVGIFLAMLRFAATESINPSLSGLALEAATVRYGLEWARLLLLSGAFLAVVCLRDYLKPTLTGTALIALTFLELTSVGFHQRYLRSDAWEQPPSYIKFLQNDRSKFRVLTAGTQSLPANDSEVFGIDDVSSRMPFNSSHYSDVIRKYFDAAPLPYPIARRVSETNRGVLDLLNAKYLLFSLTDEQQSSAIEKLGFELKIRDGLYRVFENPSVWNRAYLASSVKVIPDEATSLTALSSLRRGDVILEERPAPTVAGIGEGRVNRLEYDFDRIFVSVHASTPALLVLAENYAPGWNARTGNRPVKIFRANYTFQAVQVPAGDSEICFSYTPPGLVTGFCVTTAAILVIAVLILWPRFARRNIVSA